MTSNFYSVLFYNSEVWHLTNLNENIKKSLLTASAGALKMALHYPNFNISYATLHSITNRATPEMYCTYKLSLLLFKTSIKFPIDEWIHLNHEQILMSRQIDFRIKRNNIKTIGMNALASRFHVVNIKIPLEWLNLN